MSEQSEQSEQIENPGSKLAFDVIMGIWLPLFCLIFDPIVFIYFLSSYHLFAYFLIGLEIATLTLWLVFGMRLIRWAGLIAGILFSGALFALILGIVLLPLSIIGLIFLIGLFGFAPFFTFVIFYHHGKQAFKQAYHAHLNRVWLHTSFVLGISFAILIPTGVQLGTHQIISHSIKIILEGEPQTITSATQRLQLIFWCRESCFDEIVWAYEKAEDNLVRQKNLAQVYHDITGKDVENRLSDLLLD